MKVSVDSLNKQNARSISYLAPLNNRSYSPKSPTDSVALTHINPINLDSLYEEASAANKSAAVSRAIAAATSSKQEFEFKEYSIRAQEETISRHYIEWHKKFTLSIACLIFFFIGAPLGAIIRKGGLGLPVVLSVMLFIIYYIFDSTGYKLARDGRWPPLEGTWLSSIIFLPLGVFLTYKAARDSVILNADAYALFFKKIFGKRMTRDLIKKEVVMHNADLFKVNELIDRQNTLITNTINYFKDRRKTNYFVFWKEGIHSKELVEISQILENIVEEMNNTTDHQVYLKLREYPILPVERYNISTQQKWVRYTLGIVFPLGLPYYIYIKQQQKRLINDLTAIARINQELLNLIN
jgi:lipopolysaccharide export system permease protein